MPNAVARFPPLVSTITASPVAVRAAATITQPSAVRPAAAQATSGTTPEVMSRTPLIAVRARTLSAATPKLERRLPGLQEEAAAEDDDGDAGDDRDYESGEFMVEGPLR